MKHLRRFNESVDTNQIEQYLKDLLVPFEDLGCKVQTDHVFNHPHILIEYKITNNNYGEFFEELSILSDKLKDSELVDIDKSGNVIRVNIKSKFKTNIDNKELEKLIRNGLDYSDDNKELNRIFGSNIYITLSNGFYEISTEMEYYVILKDYLDKYKIDYFEDADNGILEVNFKELTKQKFKKFVDSLLGIYKMVLEK